MQGNCCTMWYNLLFYLLQQCLASQSMIGTLKFYHICDTMFVLRCFICTAIKCNYQFNDPSVDHQMLKMLNVYCICHWNLLDYEINKTCFGVSLNRICLPFWIDDIRCMYFSYLLQIINIHLPLKFFFISLFGLALWVDLEHRTHFTHYFFHRNSNSLEISFCSHSSCRL